MRWSAIHDKAFSILIPRTPVFVYFSQIFSVRPRIHLANLAQRQASGELDDDDDFGNLRLLELLGFTTKELSDLATTPSAGATQPAGHQRDGRVPAPHQNQTPDHGNVAGINAGENSAMNRTRQLMPRSGAKPELAMLNKARWHVRAGGHRSVEFRAELRHWLTQNDRRKDELKRNPVVLWAQPTETARIGLHDRGDDRPAAVRSRCKRRFKDPVASPAPM